MDGIKTFRALCIQAFEDGKIMQEEKEFLDNQALSLNLTDSEKKQIEEEVFLNKNNQTANLEAYRQQAIAVLRKGKPTQDERALLDVLRIKCDLTKEQQKQIEAEILQMLPKNNAIVTETRTQKCSNCGKTSHDAIFCPECGTKHV